MGNSWRQRGISGHWRCWERANKVWWESIKSSNNILFYLSIELKGVINCKNPKDAWKALKAHLLPDTKAVHFLHYHQFLKYFLKKEESIWKYLTRLSKIEQLWKTGKPAEIYTTVTRPFVIYQNHFNKLWNFHCMQKMINSMTMNCAVAYYRKNTIRLRRLRVGKEFKTNK